MRDEIVSVSYEEKLKICINTLRDVLNEMCCTVDNPELSLKKLIVSQQLDDLIVEYMILKNANIEIKLTL